MGAHDGPGQLPRNADSMKRPNGTMDGFSSDQFNLLLPQNRATSRWRWSSELPGDMI